MVSAVNLRDHIREQAENAAIGIAAGVGIHGGLLEHFANIGWTVLAALASATAVGLARIGIRHAFPRRVAARLVPSSDPPPPDSERTVHRGAPNPAPRKRMASQNHEK